jgi:acyl carrier protein
MNKELIKQKLIVILEKIILRKIPNISEEINLGDDGFGIDSMSFLKFLTEVEMEFSIEIEDDYWNYRNMNNLYKIINYVHSMINA